MRAVGCYRGMFKRVGRGSVEHHKCWPRTIREPAAQGAVMGNLFSGQSVASPAVYQIKVKGQLSADWRAWFDGMMMALRASA